MKGKTADEVARLHKDVGPGCLVSRLELPRWGPNLPQHQWKLDLGVMELLGALPLAEFCWDSCCLDNLDARRPHPVTRCHLSVHVFYSTIQSCVSVLLVHVVITSPTLVSQPDSIVVDRSWIFLKNLQAETQHQNSFQKRHIQFEKLIPLRLMSCKLLNFIIYKPPRDS